MNIIKGTTSSATTNALVLLDESRKPIKNVLEFDTDTHVASLSGGGTDTATHFYFCVDAESEVNALVALLDDDLKAYVKVAKGKVPKKAMKDADTGLEETMMVQSMLQPMLVQCSSCSTYFAAFKDSYSRLWTLDKTNPTDKLFTVTEINKDTFVCDNCSSSVALFDENPW